ncbi:MAG: hypothetical protein JWN17_2768, partial [Frankiales bacterium]|nr:hypothetical protein [Frankiales bacterium]
VSAASTTTAPTTVARVSTAPATAPTPAPAVDDETASVLPQDEAAPVTPASVAAPAPVVPLRSLLRPRLRRVDLAVAALLGLLGFGVAVQVRSTQGDGLLASARQEDLVRILDDLSNRSDRLRTEVGELQAARERLTTGTDRDQAALEEARRRSQVLGVLAGTVPAEGQGIVLTLDDPTGEVGADDLLDALEELRDAGAEAVQVAGAQGTGPVRVVASTAFLERDGGVEVDGTLLRQPYAFTVVGDPATLAAALAIPGGVTDSVEQQGGSVTVSRRPRVTVGALRPLVPPRYARPAPGASPGTD